MMVEKPKVIVIIGPTSSGKSDLAVEIAKRFKGEVVSADSRQVYKGLDIGSGKITKKEMKGVPHHLLDIASPKTTFTVAKYKRFAEKKIEEVLQRHKLPIICGGTGFYIDSLIYDWKIPEVPPQPKIRKRLAKKSTVELFKMLSELDPERAKAVDRNNRVRLMRALEIVITTGETIPRLELFRVKSSNYDFMKIGIKLPTEKLKKRISKRIIKRLGQGMIKEIDKLHNPPTGRGVTWKKLDSFGLEYRYVSRYLRNLISYEVLIDTLEKESSRYAKRQMTWFNRDRNTIWINDPRKAFSVVRGFLGLEVLP
ncbi:MAG: tRNA (adenosine(37)-N6)-dimethylallyltransferase MiaA [Candidatus Taylorbacteria bacterium]|nr:tRNA (adenosine(37)-N6)-dimethylallyltransferase MiaA [Candidatus Taylorbacteria bacterium]